MEKKGFAPFGFDHGVRQMPHMNTGPVGTHIPNVPGIFGALTSQWTGSQPGESPSWQAGYFDSNFSHNNFDLKIPTTEKSGIITSVQVEKDPMFIVMRDNDDNKTWTLGPIPFDRLREMNPKPSVNRAITVVMQRNPDKNAYIGQSQIQTIKIF